MENMMEGTTADWLQNDLCNTIIPNGEPENLHEGSHDCDADYEGIDNSEDIETSLTKDMGLPTVNDAGPSDPSPKTRDAPVASQEGNSRRSAHDRLGQRENVTECQGTRRAW